MRTIGLVVGLVLLLGGMIGLFALPQTIPQTTLCAVVSIVGCGLIVLNIGPRHPGRHFEHSQSLPDVGVGHCDDCRARVWFDGKTNEPLTLSSGRQAVTIGCNGLWNPLPYSVGDREDFRSPVAAYIYALMLLGASASRAIVTADRRYKAAMECRGD